MLFRSAASNGDLVSAAAKVVELSGRAVADPTQARALLTLQDPPDRTAYKEAAGV